MMIAVGPAFNAKLITADEPTMAPDVPIQAQILKLMTDLSAMLASPWWRSLLVLVALFGDP